MENKTTKEDFIKKTIQDYEYEIRGIESEIEMYEYNKKKSKDPDYKSFCDYKIEVRRCHIEELFECINELKKDRIIKRNYINF